LHVDESKAAKKHLFRPIFASPRSICRVSNIYTSTD